MLFDEATPDLETVTVNLGIIGETPFAKPDKCRCWKADTVAFHSNEAFTVEFKADAPFHEHVLRGVRVSEGRYLAVAEVIEDTEDEDRSFGYNLTVGGHTVDPEVVVTRDPRR